MSLGVPWATLGSDQQWGCLPNKTGNFQRARGAMGLAQPSNLPCTESSKGSCKHQDPPGKWVLKHVLNVLVGYIGQNPICESCQGVPVLLLFCKGVQVAIYIHLLLYVSLHSKLLMCVSNQVQAAAQLHVLLCVSRHSRTFGCVTR